jgi:outer membrane protein assembly factor BamB
LKWSYTHPGGATADEWESSPVIDATGLVYLQARRSLCVFDYSGAFEWSFSTNAAGTAHSSSPALGPDGQIYWGTGDLDVLYAVKSNWAFDWSYRTGGTLESSPAVSASGDVYVGSYDNNLYALTPDGALAWTYATGDNVYSSPAVDASGNIYVGSRDNRFYALTSIGTLSWSYLTNDANIDSSPAIDARDWIYVGAQDDRIYAFTADGTIVWTYVSGESVNSSPAIGSGGKLFVGSNDNKLHAVGSTSVTYTLYGDAAGLENWIAVPFDNTGISTTEHLGNLVGGLFPVTAGDTIEIERMIASTQSVETTTGDYNGSSWDWSPSGGYSIVIGAMYKLTITIAAGANDSDLTISGCCGVVQFELYDLSGDDDNDNWISVPCDALDLNTTVEIGESIATKCTPLIDDTLTIEVLDAASQSVSITSGVYDGADWQWDPSEGDAVWLGRPFIVRPYRAGGMPTITWP